MKEFYRLDSPEYEITSNLELLWNLIGESNSYPDIRFCEIQQKIIHEKILNFLFIKNYLYNTKDRLNELNLRGVGT
jgi:hypothetical protein